MLDGVSPYRKHLGKTFRWIRDNDSQYYGWLIRNVPIEVIDDSGLIPLEDYVSGSVSMSLLELRNLLRFAYDEGCDDEHMKWNPGIGPSFDRSWEDSETLAKFELLVKSSAGVSANDVAS
jgi:hypothetical protein